MNSALAVAIILSVAVMNLFFGYWRSGARKMSLQWMLAIHIPVAISAILRLTLFSHNWSLLPAFVGAFALGQFAGSQVRRMFDKRQTHHPILAVRDHNVAVQTGASNLRLR